MVLLGLMGIKKAGKDTCADFLVRNHGFIKKSFADPLKRACQELFLFTDYQLYGTQEQKEEPDPRWFGCTPRLALQYVGTNLLRDNLNNIMPGLGQNIFTHRFELWYKEASRINPQIQVVIADVRFENEVNFVKSLGGKVIKIHRPDVQTDDAHPSEVEQQSISTYDYLLDNTGTREELFYNIDHIMHNLLETH